MSEDKIEIYIEIGPNLKTLLKDTLSEMDLYNEPVAAESIFATVFSNIKNMVVDILTEKNKKNTESTGSK